MTVMRGILRYLEARQQGTGEGQGEVTVMSGSESEKRGETAGWKDERSDHDSRSHADPPLTAHPTPTHTPRPPPRSPLAQLVRPRRLLPLGVAVHDVVVAGHGRARPDVHAVEPAALDPVQVGEEELVVHQRAQGQAGAAGLHLGAEVLDRVEVGEVHGALQGRGEVGCGI